MIDLRPPPLSIATIALCGSVGLLWAGCPPTPPPPESTGTATPAQTTTMATTDVAVPTSNAKPLPHHPSPPSKANKVGWTRLTPSITGGMLTGTAPIGDDLLVTTQDGELFRVASSEERWTPLGARLDVALLDVAVAHNAQGQTAIATLDEEGRIRWSLDQGTTWTLLNGRPKGLPNLFDPVTTSTSSPYRRLRVKATQDSWSMLALGGTTMAVYSRDGGATWTLKDLGGRSALYNGAIHADGTLVAVGNRGQVYRLPPRSNQWERLRSGSKEPWRAVAITPAGTLVAGGLKDRFAVRGVDDDTWERRDLQRANFVALVALNEREWFAATHQGAVLKTRDAGRRWTTLRPSDGRVLTDLDLSPKGTLLALGPELLLRGPERGRRWETVRGKGIDTLLALWVGRGLEVAVGRHGLMQLKRGHDPWEVVSLPKLPPQAELTAVDFKHGRFGWITSSTGEIYRTEDGGRTWNSTRPEPQTRWTTIAALDPLNVFVGGVQGALSTSSDRGTRWNPVEWPLDNTQVGVPDIMTIAITSRDSAVDVWLGADRGLLLRKDPQRLAFAPVDLGLRNGISDLEAVDERLWLLDQSGMVLRQDGRDQPWRVIALDPGAAIVDIAWSTGDLGLATLESGALVRTTDGGHTWEVLNQPAEALIADLVGVAKATFVAVGHGGTIQRTTDGGLHWTLLPKKVGQALNAVCRDGDLLVACGFSGACLSSPDQGASWKLWEGAPKGLGKGHVTAMDTTPHGTMALGGVGGVWLRGPEGGWTHLAPSAEAGPLREIRRIKLRPDGTLAVIAATGDLWHAVDGHLEPVAMPATGKGDQPRVLDMAWSADDTVLVSLNRGLWELSWPPGPKPAWNARPEALHRVTQAPIRRLSTDLRGRVWLLGPGGIWASGVETAWVQPLAALPARPLDMAFASSTLGYAACDGGVILRTEDGGTSWVAEHTGTRSTLTAIDLRPDLKVTAIGHGGVILERPAP